MDMSLTMTGLSEKQSEIKEIQIVTVSVSTFYTSRNNKGKRKENQHELILNFKMYQPN